MSPRDLHGPDMPSAWIERFAPLARVGGDALDLACGRGRHARALAARGHRVLAVDRDAEALAQLAGVAGVTTLQADLEAGPWPLPGRRFDLVVVSNYLHRPLFPALAGGLAPAGVLVYETFMAGNERLRRPSNPDFLLRPGELLAAFGGLTVVAFEQGRIERPFPAVVQRLCGVNGVPAQDVRLP